MQMSGPSPASPTRSSGDAVLVWSYVDDAIMVRAVNEHGDSKALYDFFLTNALYIAP